MHESTNHINAVLAASARLAADSEKLTEPSNHTNAVLAISARLTADFEKLTEPSNHLKSALAASARLTADFEKLTEPSNHLKSALAISARLAADFEKLRKPRNHFKTHPAESASAGTAPEKAKQARSNNVKNYYDRDLAYQGKEEPNHAIEDYNKVIISNLELEKSIFGDGLAFSSGNKATPINITINVRQLTIGHMIQGEKIEMKSEVSSGHVGVLNIGDMRAKSITGSVSILADSNQHQVAEAFQTLTEAVRANQDISSQQQSEILEQLEFLSGQATLDPSERKVGLIKPTLSILSKTLSAGGGLAEIWSEWGDAIMGFFGIQV